VSPAKAAKPTKMPFGLRTGVGLRNHVLNGKGKLRSGNVKPIVKYRDSGDLCKKTDEPIVISPRKHVLDWCLDPHGKGQFWGKGGPLPNIDFLL